MLKHLTVTVATTISLWSGSSLAQSPDPWIGTWKVNLEKSTYNPGPKPTFPATMKVEAVADGIQLTIDGRDAQGQPTHETTAGRFDGKQYPIKGAPNANTTMGYRRLDGRSFEAIIQVNDVPVATNTVVISSDGKTWTATQAGTNAQGLSTRSIIVMDRQ